MSGPVVEGGDSKMLYEAYVLIGVMESFRTN